LKFRDVLQRAFKEPTLADSLSLVAMWENERAVKQALQGKRDPNDGSLWNTCFKYAFTKVLDGWGPASVSTEAPRDSLVRCRALWDLLDEISTLGDSIKPSSFSEYVDHYHRVNAIAKKRHDVMHVDEADEVWRLRDMLQSHFGGEDVNLPTPELLERVLDRLDDLDSENEAPVPMLLFCPMCHEKHIDEGEFASKRHHTHACQGILPNGRWCGNVWRPAIVATVGVEALPGFINDSPATKDEP
jgi:hypothetical protein